MTTTLYRVLSVRVWQVVSESFLYQWQAGKNVRVSCGGLSDALYTIPTGRTESWLGAGELE